MKRQKADQKPTDVVSIIETNKHVEVIQRNGVSTKYTMKEWNKLALVTRVRLRREAKSNELS